MKHYHPLLLERINIFFVFAALFFCCWCLGSCVCFKLGGDLVVPKSCFCVPPPPSINHQNQPFQTKVRLKDGDLCQLCLQATASQRRRYWQAAESVNHGYHGVSGGGPEFCGVNEVESGGENWGEKHTKYGFFLEQRGWMVDIMTYQLYCNEDVFVGQKLALLSKTSKKGWNEPLSDISPFLATKNLQVTSWDFTVLSWNSKIEVWKMNVLFTTEIFFCVPCYSFRWVYALPDQHGFELCFISVQSQLETQIPWRSVKNLERLILSGEIISFDLPHHLYTLVN